MKYFQSFLIHAFIVVLLSNGTAHAQVSKQRLVWNQVDIAGKVAPKTSVTFFLNERYYIAPTSQHQLVLRSNIQHNLKHGWAVFGGYTYFLQSPHDPEASYSLTIPEHRLQQGFTQQYQYGRVALLQRYQAEQRWMHNTANKQLADGYRFVFRFRYRLLVDVMLWDKNMTSPKGDLVLRIGDEIHLNAGKSIKGQPFDQNRAMAMLQYFITDNLMPEAGYINWYQQRNGNQGFYNRHIATTGIQWKIDFTKKHPNIQKEPPTQP